MFLFRKCIMALNFYPNHGHTALVRYAQEVFKQEHSSQNDKNISLTSQGKHCTFPNAQMLSFNIHWLLMGNAAVTTLENVLTAKEQNMNRWIFLCELSVKMSWIFEWPADCKLQNWRRTINNFVLLKKIYEVQAYKLVKQQI